ncbi:MAG TPA: toxic anion resistance protein [Chromatiales bacterium]|nr:toxic anion resistance protein [Thiotrichales bacterium]HIP69486.1 toxic anion resistance protein [Chromatiales bacterium]
MSETTLVDELNEDLLKPLKQENAEVVSYKQAEADDKKNIEQILDDLDISDTQSIISFGSSAQEKLTTISDKMLEGVQNKDVGPAGESLNEMVAVMRGFDVSGIDPNKKLGFFARLFGRAKPVVKFLQQYEGVRRQIDTVINKLDGHKTKLLTDIVSLDRLYDANLDYFHDLEIYIAAGDERLRRLDEEEIPALKKTAEETDDVAKAQELRDLRARRDDLERRVHDLRLTRQITMQGLPSIRLLQENDKSLVTKINSTLTNTVPLWRQQMAQAITIYRSGAAADSVKEAADFTNELLEKNAENLKMANKTVREQIERGIVDIETVKKANDTLIETIEDSLRIAEEGKQKRKEAVVQLEQSEKELREALLAAKAKAEA